MKTKAVIKVLGAVAPFLSSGLTLVTGWLDDKKLDAKIDAKIDEKIKQALAAIQEAKPE